MFEVVLNERDNEDIIDYRAICHFCNLLHFSFKIYIFFINYMKLVKICTFTAYKRCFHI